MTKGRGTKKGGGSRVSRKRVPNTGLTAKQERFVLLLVYGHEGKFLSQAGAYRLAYKSDGMSDNAIAVEACKLLQNPKVSLRVAQLRNAMAIERGISVETETEKLERLYERAINGYMEVERDLNSLKERLKREMEE